MRTHPLAHPQTTPIGIGIGYRSGRWVRKRVCGGREWMRACQSPTLGRSRAQNYTCSKRAVPYLYSLYTVFHSVIFNSVTLTYKIQRGFLFQSDESEDEQTIEQGIISCTVSKTVQSCSVQCSEARTTYTDPIFRAPDPD